MKYVFYALLIYLLWQFIFKFVIPLYRAGRQIKKGFRDMHSRMSEQMNQQQPGAFQTQTAAKPQETPKPSSKDYIDFEEVK